MDSFSMSTVPSNLVHSAAATEYQHLENGMACRAVLDSQIGINSHVSSNSVNAVWHNYPADTNEQRQVISASYNGSASINLDVKPFVQLIADILKVESEGEPRHRTLISDFEQKTKRMIPGLSQLIHKITCEIWCDCPEKGNAHKRVKSLLHLLSNYSPDAKVVLVLTAFAIRYGDVMVTMNHHANKSDNILNSLVLLKQLTSTLESESTLEPHIIAIKETVNIVLVVVDYIIELKSFQSWNNIHSEIRIDDIIFLMVAAVIYCGLTVSEFDSGSALSLNEKSEWVVSTKKQITSYKEELRKHIEFYRRREGNTTNIKLSTTLRFDTISTSKKHRYPLLFHQLQHYGNILYNPGETVPTTLRLFQDSKVLILYSSLAIETFQEELTLLGEHCKNTLTRFGYKIVWMPIGVQKHITDKKRYNLITSKMPYCCTLTYEAIQQVNCGLVHLLNKDWGFSGKPMLVVLDERGRVVCQNALPMIHLYGERAFPFTAEHEKQLLAESKGLQLLLVQIDAKLSEWIMSKEQYVCLYGGDNIEWCKMMVPLLLTLTKEANIKVETAYIGRNSHHKKTVEATLTSIREAKLGHIMESGSTLFWERLQKFVLHYSTHDSSDVSKGFLSWASPLLTFSKSHDSWVAIGNADHVLVFSGSFFVSGLNVISPKLEQWKSKVTTVNFLQELKEWLKDIKKNHGKHCQKLEIARNPASIRGDVHCPTCNEPMQMTMLYRCGY